MALTKVTGQVIKNTTDVTVGVLTVTNTLAVGGTVSIGGTLTYEDVTNIDSVGLITARDGISVTSGNVTITGGGSFVGDGSNLTGVASTDNIRTNTNATFLQNINVSGTSTVTGAGTFLSDVSVAGDFQIADTIKHEGDVNTKIRFPTTDQISVETAGSEQLRINSNNILKGPTVGRAQFFHSVVNPVVQIEGASDFDRQMSITSSSAEKHFGGSLILAHQKSGSVSGNTTLAAGDDTGVLSFQGHDGTNFIEGARIASITETGVASNKMFSSLNFYTNSGVTTISEKLRITARGDIAFNRIGMSTAVGDSTDTTLSTADPLRFVFNNDHSNGYTDTSLKLYLYNLSAIRHGFTSGPSHDLQYHVSGSDPANTNLSISKHTFFKENKKIFQLGYKSTTGENVVGHVGLTTGTSKLAWGTVGSDNYRLGTSGGAALVFGVDGDSEFFGIDGHWTGQRHAEYMRISKEGYMTKPYQPHFLVQAGRGGDGYTDDPYQFRTSIRNQDSAFKMGAGSGQYERYYPPVTGLYFFTTHAAYGQTGVSFGTRIARYNASSVVQETYELYRFIQGSAGSHYGGAGSCLMYCTAGDYITLIPQYTPYHLNSTLNFFAGFLVA